MNIKNKGNIFFIRSLIYISKCICTFYEGMNLEKQKLNTQRQRDLNAMLWLL